MSIQIPYIKLENGSQMPMLGLGTYDSLDEKELSTAVKSAIDAGYRHFDCAYFYHNEHIIGKAINDSIAESNGNLKREDFYIVSKCWNNYHSKERVPVCLDITLKSFGFEYIDLYLIHWPMGFKEGGDDIPFDENKQIIESGIHFTETWKAMEELVNQGKCKSIGISNFSIEQTKEILNMCKIRPVCNQVEVNPYFQNSELVDFCHKENIRIVAYAPLRSTTYTPEQKWLKPENLAPQENPDLVAMAKKYNKTTAQIILRWLIQSDIVVIPKSVTPSRIIQNSQIFDFELSKNDMEIFKNMKTGSRINHFEGSRHHLLYPFKNE